MTPSFIPIDDRLLVCPEASPESTPGGLIIPTNTQDQPQRGTVIAVGPKVNQTELDPPSQGYTVPINVGDTVLFGKFMGREVVLDSKTYLVMRRDDILGKFSSSN